MEMLTTHLPYHIYDHPEPKPQYDFESALQTQTLHFPTSYYHCLATLSGHTSYISSLTLAGNLLFSGSSDCEIRAWPCLPLDHDSDANNVVAVCKGAVKSLLVFSDKIVSAHQDHKIRVWKIRTDFHGQAHKLERIATLPTLGDRTLKLLNPTNQVEVRRNRKCTWVHHVDAVSALALSSDESLLYSVSWDRTLKIWRTSDFKCLESVSRAHDDAINAVAVSSLDGEVYTGSADKTIRVWRRNPRENKHELITTLEKHKSGVNALLLSHDGSRLCSGSSDRSIMVWEKEGDGEIRVSARLRGHSKAVLCLAGVADLICSGSADNSVRVWKGEGGKYCCLAVMEGHRGPVKCLAMAAQTSYDNGESSEDYLVYSGSLDRDVKVWQLSVPTY